MSGLADLGLDCLELIRTARRRKPILRDYQTEHTSAPLVHGQLHNTFELIRVASRRKPITLHYHKKQISITLIQGALHNIFELIRIIGRIKSTLSNKALQPSRGPMIRCFRQHSFKFSYLNTRWEKTGNAEFAQSVRKTTLLRNWRSNPRTLLVGSAHEGDERNECVEFHVGKSDQGLTFILLTSPIRTSWM